MASVWKRLQRVNKRAAKFQYTASYHRIDLETTSKWKPNKLSVVWSRRSRRVVTDPLDWEPSLKDPLRGSVIWPVPDNKTVAVTLFKDSRTNELEDKDWTFVLEDVSSNGKRRRLAVSPLNMRKHASLEPTQRTITVTLQPTTQKITAASINLTVHCVLLREGQATDEDMQSLASLFSLNNNSDIAPLEDLEEDDYSISDNSASIKQMLDLTHQMELMTNSLTASELAATPISIQSLNFDNSRTPTAPMTPLTPFSEDPDFVDRQKTPTATANDLRILESGDRNHQEPHKVAKFDAKFDGKAFELPRPQELKGVVFKTKHLSKHNLKPLELKTNLNSVAMDTNTLEKGSPVTENTPVSDDKLQVTRIEKDKTPVQDLLEWCKEVTREYKQCKVTNLTTSWRNGLAFCAIIHHYRPDLIDFSALQPEDAEANLRVALEASGKLGVSQVLTARDVMKQGAPDRLAVMTHLFQLRAHFTGGELQVEQLGNNPQESSYMVGRHDTDSELPSSLFSLEIAGRKQRTSLSSQDSVDSQNSQERNTSPERAHQLKDRSPTSVKDVRGIFLQHSKSLLGKMLSPTKEKLNSQKVEKDPRLIGSIQEAERERGNTKWFGDPLGASRVNSEVMQVKPIKLMTRKQLTDPFGSDEDDDEIATLQAGQTSTPKSEAKSPNTAAPPVGGANKRDSRSMSPGESLPKPTPQLLSRHDELKERARQLLEATKREAREKDGNKRHSSRENDDRNQADNLVNGVRNVETSPKKMTEESRQAQLRERARRLIADARAGVVSPTSPMSPSRHARHGTVEIISRQSMLDEIAAAGGVEQLDNILSRRDSNRSNRSGHSNNSSDSHNNLFGDHEDSPNNGNSGSPPPAPHNTAASPLHSFSALIERLTPDKDADDDDLKDSEEEVGSYIQSEMEALEREQSAIDEQAALLEKELRRVMETSNSTEEEDKLMTKWFTLVNKKNALLRRQMQLNILEQEEDLSRRCNLLARELRLSLAVEEWRKTPGQRRRERLLLQELLAAVNERDRLVHEMDSQERAIEDDDEIERNLSQVEIQRKNNCILQ